jgi:hypothetical protein
MQYAYYVDASPPGFLVWPRSGSEINDDTLIDVNVRDDSGVSSAWFDNGDGAETAFESDVSFLPGWSGTGERTLTLWAEDSLGNAGAINATYTLVEEPVKIPPESGEPEGCARTEEIEVSCDDGEDNDCDGAADLNDADCRPIVMAYEVSRHASISVEQGRDAVVSHNVKNTGEKPLDISIEITETPGVQVISNVKSIHLGVKDERAHNSKVHAPLGTKPDEYNITFEFTGPSKIDRTVIVEVAANPLVSERLPGVERDIRKYGEDVDGIEAAGVDAREARSLIQNATREVGLAGQAVEDDDLHALEGHVSAAEMLVGQLSMSITLLKLMGTLYAAAPYVLVGAIIVLFGAYLVSRVIMPYTALKRGLAELESQEKTILQSRRSAEMEYFRRQIDEKTFRNLMVREQEKLLMLRSQIKEMRQKTHGLFGLVFSPSEFRGFYRDVLKRARRAEGAGGAGFRLSLPARPRVPFRLPKLPGRGRPSKWAAVKGEIKSLEGRLDSVAGARRKEAEELLHMAHDYSGKGMDSMARYYVEKARKILG